MSRRAAFRQSDLDRATKAAAKVGYEVAVDTDTGIIRILPTGAKPAPPSAPLDAELAEWASKHGYG